MKKIRLKDEYPWFSGDEYIEVTDEIAEVFAGGSKDEQSYKRRRYYHRAFYSLDAGDGIEKKLFVSLSPQELYEKLTEIEDSTPHHRCVVEGEQADWKLVLSVFAVKTAGTKATSVTALGVRRQRVFA